MTDKASISHSVHWHGLDHLRALAIGLVFFFHYKNPIYGHPDWTADAGKFGWTGVDLFFVLSGFLISSQLFTRIKNGQQVSFKAFFLKRFFRIVPAFWVVLAIYFCFPVFHERESLSPIWRFLTFTINFGLDQKQFGTFTHAWSLCVEEHFYLLLPLVILFLQKFNLFNKGYWLIIFLFIAGVLLRLYSWHSLYVPDINAPNAQVAWFKFIYYPTYNRLDGLLAGISIAILYHFLPNIWNYVVRFGNYTLITGLLVLLLAYLLTYQEKSYAASIMGFPVVSIGFGFLVIGAISPTSFLYQWPSEITRFIAAVSYSFYLSHKGVIHLTQVLFSPWVATNSNLMLLISLFFSLIAGVALHLAVEKPFLKLREKLI